MADLISHPDVRWWLENKQDPDVKWWLAKQTEWKRRFDLDVLRWFENEPDPNVWRSFENRPHEALIVLAARSALRAAPLLFDSVEVGGWGAKMFFCL
jgi:hypothetical protein